MLRNVVVVLMRKELGDIGATIPGNKGRLDDNNKVARQTGNRGSGLRRDELGEHVAIGIDRN
jgi:hypothetical protein